MAHANSNAGAPARLNRACCDCDINIIPLQPRGRFDARRHLAPQIGEIAANSSNCRRKA
jgi:hypothetical protein